MKHFFSISKLIAALLISLIFLSVEAIPQAQTSAISNHKYSGTTGGSLTISWTFTADSTGSFVSNPFTFPSYDGVDFYTLPITYRLRHAGIGVPNTFVTIQGRWGTDTLSLDTLSQHATNETEGDTLGTLDFNGKRAPSYQIYIRNITADINSGKIDLTFAKPEEYWGKPFEQKER